MGKLIFDRMVWRFIKKEGDAPYLYGYYVTFSRIKENYVAPIKMRFGIVAGAEFYNYCNRRNRYLMVCPHSELELYKILMEQFDTDLFKFKFLEAA